MPYFTRQVAVDGSLILQIHIGVSSARHQALIASRRPIPPPILALALLDTGASITCVDTSILSQLELAPTGAIDFYTPSTGSEPSIANQYDISLWIPSAPNALAFHQPAFPVMETQLSITQGFQVLIGRDILKSCYLVHDGLHGLFSLAY